ncbi:hypothetical protein P3T76_008821 [Phytophthora citrophthora]|uniref:Uncharacterized protein n=1 Tax=Phytophthora citrophthora TaxID=4793 RepID=A0AAD9GJ58_9STRA|nr:hypothetical protein P3T76_008821 [Phytophthora citrophthora]
MKKSVAGPFNDYVHGQRRSESVSTRPSLPQDPGLDIARRSEQAKVAERALGRSRQLTNSKKQTSKASTHKTRGSAPSKADQIREAVKRCSDEREKIKKQRAVDAMKLAEALLNGAYLEKQ